MALVLIKEDGSGLANANSYADAAEGDAFHEAHLYATDWTGASAANKAAALVFATRLIDAHYQFRGFKAHDTQALQWPREFARDDDALRVSGIGGLMSRSEFFASNVVPRLLRDATIETARELIKANRTEDPDGEGLGSLSVTGTLSLTFNKSDRRPVIPHVAQSMLSKLGEYLNRSGGMARLVRT
ncbi:MAG TPA: DnaT-like ssDNA-binding protein [Candidatus Acidoferrum sp.]|nr:DnaT-like ssDNA-binding protein [Candidatus Acidoferrum sp.]